MAERKQVDWEAVELDYRAGTLTIRNIGEKHGVSHALVARKAKERGWPRDIKEKVHQRADDLVSKAAVTVDVTSQKAVNIIEANAKAIADIRLAHRQDIRQTQQLINVLREELAHQTFNRDLYEQLGELLRSPDDKGMDKLNDIYMKAMSLPSRIDGVKKLTDAQKVAIGIEREAFGMESDQLLDSDDKVIKRIERVIVDVTPKQ